ncbi:ankyrin repeat domain-containing protein [Novosphingopyxis sp.]|uniref:ankyrin repeat domain-containing protein n=1 Tax=Novosphingopyxis sp. TaxID=2709690 RepID=UPI003B5BB8BF
MRHIVIAALFASSFAVLPAPGDVASAQQSVSPGYTFLKAVEDRDGDKVTTALQVPGTNIVNARRADDGRTAMHLVVERRDSQWIKFLLANHADPNIGDRNGDTPLMLATQLGYLDGMDTLLTYGGKVDETNRAGETPLIRAVQLRDPETVRLLLKYGADPDIADHVSGRSARDYARQDGRAREILNLLEAKGETKPARQQGELDFSGIK